MPVIPNNISSLSPASAKNTYIEHDSLSLPSAADKNPAIKSQTFRSWETEHTITHDEKDRLHTPEAKDPRNYPKTHDKYDLAYLRNWNKPKGPVCTEKAAKKCNINQLALLTPPNTQALFKLYDNKEGWGGVPGFIDAFLRGEPGGRTEGFGARPEQFSTTSFDPQLGGFLISPNPSNIPERGKTYTDDATALLEKTRGKNGFGLVCYWIPPGTYERYPTFQKLFPHVKIPESSPAFEERGHLPPNRQDRDFNTESNQQYLQRTGNRFLSVPVNLERKHIPLLEELTSTVNKVLKDVYQTDPEKEKVEIFTHSPVYDMDSCGLHVHVRVNQGRHPLEEDLRNLPIGQSNPNPTVIAPDSHLNHFPHNRTLIEQLESNGRLTDFPQTKNKHFISYNIAAKMERARDNGIEFLTVPNVFKNPALAVSKQSLTLSPHPLINRENDPNSIQISKKSAAKYNCPEIGLVPPEGMQERISRYAKNEILPTFIYNFFTKEDDPKAKAFQQHPEQFPATHFSTEGGMFLMPNTKYVPGKSESFERPEDILASTRNTGGFALVGYWVPPGVFEGKEPFNKLFGVNTQRAEGPESRETIAAYNKRTDSSFIVNPIDLQKKHIPMLNEFKEMSLKHLQDVYGVQPDKEKVDIYLHSPIYGNRTAGLHIHVRINQNLPAGEIDSNRLGFDKLMSILNDEKISDSHIREHILNSGLKTNSGSFLSFSSAWGRQQFEGTATTYVPNPFRRPDLMTST